MRNLALGFALALCTLAPTLAHASDLGLAADPSAAARRAERRRQLDERLGLEDFQRTPERKGFFAGMGVASGATVFSDAFVPSIGYRFELGGGLTHRFTLGFAGGITGHLGMKKDTAGALDIVARGFLLRGLFLEAGLGATSHAPIPNHIKRPGFGGFLGLGYEFRPLKVLGVALSMQFDNRIRTDGRIVQGVLLNLGFRAYVTGKKKW